MRRRALLILASTMLGVMMLSGIALAATISCGAISSEGHCYGTRRADTMTGNAERNHMSGKRGGDEMSALKGPDAIWGGFGDDRMFAGPGSDYVGDNKGSNLLSGGPGGDYLNAYRPPDSKPAPAFNVDRIKGGRGGDSIDATDGRKDLVNCGRGAIPCTSTGGWTRSKTASGLTPSKRRGLALCLTLFTNYVEGEFCELRLDSSPKFL